VIQTGNVNRHPSAHRCLLAAETPQVECRGGRAARLRPVGTTARDGNRS
jgi:hypothetical protein